MGKLLDYANLGLDMYQTKQLASISSAQESLAISHLMENMRGDMEVEKRKLMIQFESELETLNFQSDTIASVAKVKQIRHATDELELKISGFREFTDMDRAKIFCSKLEAVEARMITEVSNQDIEIGGLVQKYVLEDDDLEEYATLQYIKEAESKESRESGWAMLWLFLSGCIGMVLAYVVGILIGDPFAESFSSEETVEMTDLMLQLFCGLSVVGMMALWKPFGMAWENITSLFSTSAMDEAKKILKNGGGQEILDSHIISYGQLTAEEIINERIRRLEFVEKHNSKTKHIGEKVVVNSAMEDYIQKIIDMGHSEEYARDYAMQYAEQFESISEK